MSNRHWPTESRVNAMRVRLQHGQVSRTAYVAFLRRTVRHVEGAQAMAARLNLALPQHTAHLAQWRSEADELEEEPVVNEGKRLRRVLIAPALLVGLLTVMEEGAPDRRSFRVLADGVPTDAELRGCSVEATEEGVGRIVLVLEHPSFAVVPLDQAIPLLEPVLAASYPTCCQTCENDAVEGLGYCASCWRTVLERQTKGW